MEVVARGVRATVPHGPASERRWIGSGRSHQTDSREAGKAATAKALAERDAKLLIVFAAEAHDLGELLAGVRDAGGDAKVIGCSTAGEILEEGPSDGAVVVTAIGGDGFAVSTAAVSAESGDLRAAGAEAAACAAELQEQTERPHKVLMVLAEGVGADLQEAIRGVHSTVGSGIPLVGGCAGDGMKMEQTFQLHGDRVLSNGVVAAAIASDGPIGLGWRHGWERVGDPMLVTRSAGGCVDEIDDQPALDAYLEHHDAPAEARNDAVAFTRWARTRPLGLGRRQRGGQEPVRCVHDANFSKRSLGVTAEVPQGGLAWLMRGDRDSILRSTETACHEAVDALGDVPPIGMVAFDCIGRRGVLGDAGVAAEVWRMARIARGAPVAGFYTYGEIARTRGVNAVHSQTLVALAFG